MASPTTYHDHYLHFNFRLEERYGFNISFEEYMEACRGEYENTGLEYKIGKKRKLIWVRIKGYRILAIKNTKRAPAALITALPSDNIHKKRYTF